jgi:hypothetical protein
MVVELVSVVAYRGVMEESDLGLVLQAIRERHIKP